VMPKKSMAVFRISKNKKLYRQRNHKKSEVCG